MSRKNKVGLQGAWPTRGGHVYEINNRSNGGLFKRGGAMLTNGDMESVQRKR